MKTSNCDIISCLAASCFSSLGGSGAASWVGSSKILLSNDGLNQSPLACSSCDELKSWEKEKSLFDLPLNSESEALSTLAAVLGGVLVVLIVLFPSDVRLERSRPDGGGGGKISFCKIEQNFAFELDMGNAVQFAKAEE